MTNLDNGMIVDYKSTTPIMIFPLMSDFKWQYIALKDRIEHPDKYIKSGEDVEVAIKRLKNWLSAHSIKISQISA